MVGLVAFPCRAFRQIPASLSTASLLCLTEHPCGAFLRSPVVPPAYPCRAFGAFLPFGPGKVARGWRTAAGVPEIPWAQVVLGNPRCRGLVGMEAPVARQGSGGGRGMGWVRVFAGNSIRLRLPVFPCFTPGTSMPRLRRFPALRLRVVARGSGELRDVLGDPERYGLAGMGAPVARHGSGRGPRHGSGRGHAAGGGVGVFR